MIASIKTNLHSLRFRILFPAVIFVLIFSCLFILINNFSTSNLLDNRLIREAVRVSNVLVESRFVLNPSYLKRMGQVIEGEIAVFNSKGQVMASSFEDSQINGFLDKVYTQGIQQEQINEKKQTIVKRIQNDGQSFLMVARQLYFSQTQQDLLIVTFSSLNDLNRVKKQAMSRTILSGLFALLVAFFSASLIFKKISDSFENILQVTDKIASGDFRSKAQLSDINELKTLSDSINRMSDKLFAYEKQVIESTRKASNDKITAAMAHEIKNPLSSMKILAQIIQTKFERDPETMEMITAFIKEINRIDRLVSDLKSISGSNSYKFDIVKPHRTLEEVISVIQPKLDHLNIRLNLDIDKTLPNVKIDADKIKQVLWNLMMNAAESMPTGGRIDIFVKYSSDKTFVEYGIADQGSGIAQKDLVKIYEPFFTTKKEGLGIGLHVSLEIVKAHDGKLSIRPGKSQGVKALLLIPVYKEI